MPHALRGFKRTFVKIRKSVAQRGLFETARLVISSLQRQFRRREHSFSDSDWDQQFHVETARHAVLEELSISSPNEFYANHYEPMNPRRFGLVLESIALPWSEYTFVDLGSGKGRVLLLAASQPFRRVIGVEFAEELHAIALRNIESYTGPRLCRDVVSVLADAVQFQFPPVPTVIFLYNPFEQCLITKVLDNLRNSLEQHPRTVWVVYYVPAGMPLFKSVDFLTLAQQVPGFGIYRSQLPATT
jgi:hypothetical protein